MDGHTDPISPRIAPTLPLILVARMIQGAGGGALQPLSQAILIESFPQEKQGEARINICLFCIDIARSFAIKASMNQAKLDALDQYQ